MGRLADLFLAETGAHLEDAECEACGGYISFPPVVQRGALTKRLIAVHPQCADVYQAIDV